MGLNWGWGGFGHSYGLELGSEVGMRRGMGLGLRWAGGGQEVFMGWVGL